MYNKVILNRKINIKEILFEVIDKKTFKLIT